ncbi:28S ribosomal protein S29, mitochondrial [Smittium mucronatum]|uniref:Small ribosomal subunit protein mS29 n=1 Tax=Smittium mucronatum TaxID=133383 RepID=A0A1R0GPW1_9FUNG|nr:28S ribosomal protein S29, mitochondrial [Smittium mucronatum]
MIFRDISRVVIEKVVESSMVPRNKSLILDGNTGSGKSSVLLQAVSSALSAGWFVIYSGETNSWVDSSNPYLPKLTDPTNFYQWTLTSNFLQSIKTLNDNESLRSNLLLKKDFVLGKQKLSADQSVFDVLDIGIKSPSLSQEALNVLLSVLDSQTDIPVMIAIDQINTFYSKTLYTDQKNVRINANHLLLINSLLPYFGYLPSMYSSLGSNTTNKTIPRGLAIGATSSTDSRFISQELNSVLETVSKDPKSFKKSNFEPINIDDFTPEETFSLLEHYRLSNLINSSPTAQSALKLWALTSGNPQKIFRSCTSFL